MGANVVVDGTPSLILATAGQVGIFMRVGEEPNIEALSVTENGTYTADGDGFNPVVVAVEAEVEALTVSENGTYTASGDGFNPVTVNVQPDLETLSVTANGTYTPTGDGFSEVTVNVQPTLETLTATANGTYTPAGDGYSAVTVAIPTYDGSYTVTPTTTEQTLETAGKVLEQDVTVEAVAETELYSTWTDIVGKYLGRNMSNGQGYFTAGYGLDRTTGEVVENSGNAACEAYLPVDVNYTYIKNDKRVYYICCYDADKNFISHLGDLNNLTYGLTLPTFPEGTKYIRFATHYNTNNWGVAIIRTA